MADASQPHEVTCTGCTATLGDDNWTKGAQRAGHRQCRRCAQANNDSRYQIGVERRRDKYNSFASERGECADHLSNFGYRMPYRPELRAVFQWDHRYGNKCFSLSIREWHRSVESLMEETSKCALVCANCHMLATQRAYSSEDKPDWVVNRKTRRVVYGQI